MLVSSKIESGIFKPQIDYFTQLADRITPLSLIEPLLDRLPVQPEIATHHPALNANYLVKKGLDGAIFFVSKNTISGEAYYNFLKKQAQKRSIELRDYNRSENFQAWFEFLHEREILARELLNLKVTKRYYNHKEFIQDLFYKTLSKSLDQTEIFKNSQTRQIQVRLQANESYLNQRKIRLNSEYDIKNSAIFDDLSLTSNPLASHPNHVPEFILKTKASSNRFHNPLLDQQSQSVILPKTDNLDLKRVFAENPVNILKSVSLYSDRPNSHPRINALDLEPNNKKYFDLRGEKPALKHLPEYILSATEASFERFLDSNLLRYLTHRQHFETNFMKELSLQNEDVKKINTRLKSYKK